MIMMREDGQCSSCTEIQRALVQVKVQIGKREKKNLKKICDVSATRIKLRENQGTKFMQ
jgi:hypothetical protein